MTGIVNVPTRQSPIIRGQQMPKFYIKTSGDRKITGVSEIHQEGCLWLPVTKHNIPLGTCSTWEEALKKAKKQYNHIEVDTCPFCCTADSIQQEKRNNDSQ